MQELIKEIEAAQIKEVTDFNVGDTIKVHAKIVRTCSQAWTRACAKAARSY